MRDFKNLTPVDHIGLIWKRRWYFIIPAFLIICGALTYAMLAQRIYKSETRIGVESSIISDDYIRAGTRITNEDRINVIRDQIQSRTFIERVIEELQLYGYGRLPDFTMDYAVMVFRKQIKVLNTSENSFSISFVSTSPEMARDVTSRVAKILIDDTDEARENKAVNTERFIDDEMRKAEAELKEQEEKIKDFKNKHLGELPEQSATNLSTLSQLRSQLTVTEGMIQNAHDQKKMLELRLQEQKQLSSLSRTTTRVENLLRPGSAEPAPSAAIQQLTAKRALLADYTAKYTPRHPDVKKLALEIAELEQQISQSSSGRDSGTRSQASITSQPLTPEVPGPTPPNQEVPDSAFNMTVAQIQAEIESRDREVARQTRERDEINRQIKLYQSRLGLAPSLEQQLLILNRENEVLRTHYSNLQNRRFTSQLAASLEKTKGKETYRVIDRANLPERPEKPSRTLIGLIGIALGIAVGLGAATAGNTWITR